MKRQHDSGESPRAITARADRDAWPQIRAALEQGATMIRVAKLRRAYVDRGNGPVGNIGSISDAGLRRLEQEGVLRFVGVDRYALAAKAPA